MLDGILWVMLRLTLASCSKRCCQILLSTEVLLPVVPEPADVEPVVDCSVIYGGRNGPSANVRFGPPAIVCDLVHAEAELQLVEPGQLSAPHANGSLAAVTDSLLAGAVYNVGE